VTVTSSSFRSCRIISSSISRPIFESVPASIPKEMDKLGAWIEGIILLLYVPWRRPSTPPGCCDIWRGTMQDPWNDSRDAMYYAPWRLFFVKWNDNPFHVATWRNGSEIVLANLHFLQNYEKTLQWAKSMRWSLFNFVEIHCCGTQALWTM
jgi:hypothetical protein